MLNNVKISFIVVSYNSQDTIRDCLDALISQITNTDEVIVYDNGSSDGTREILEEYGEELIVYHSQTNSGFSYACNWCAEKAIKASHLAFINPDAIVQPNLVNRARETFGDLSIDLIGFACKDHTQCPDRNFRRYPGVLCGLLTITDNIICRFYANHISNFDLKKYYLDGSCMFVSRKMFISANKFHNLFMYGEDVMLCDILNRNKIKAAYFNDIFYLHFRGGSSNTNLGTRSWSMLPNMLYSELYYLRSRRLIYKIVYLIFKFFEMLILFSLYKVFNSKNKEKNLFFKKRLKLLCQFALSFLLKGSNFSKSEFHTFDEDNNIKLSSDANTAS